MKIIVFLCSLLLILILNSCSVGTPSCSRVCYMVDMDNPNCRISSYDANSAVLKITSYYLQNGNYHVNRVTQGVSSLTFERRIKGTEINYGWWSENSKRDLSYTELFEKKWGRYPEPHELNSMTDEDAINWFKTVYNCNCITNEDPIDISTYKRWRGSLCADYPLGNVGYNEGSITFNDGTICQLETNGDNLGVDGDCPRSIPMKVKKPCSKCN